MSYGEILTRSTVLLALAGYFAGAGLAATATSHERLTGGRGKRARAAWTIGCLLYLAHVACAFAFYHDWSHAAAYRHTAERTAALVGWRWGGGLYFNDGFTAVWLLDAAWWWLSPLARVNRPRWLSVAIHGFLWFMVANATIVFATGPAYWFGVAGCGSLLVIWSCYGGRSKATG